MAKYLVQPWESQDIINLIGTVMQFGIPEVVLLKELSFISIFQMFASTNVLCVKN